MPVILPKERTREIRAIYNCLTQYEKFVDIPKDDTMHIAELIELGIYNHSVAKALERHVQIEWSDWRFLEMYSNIAYNVKVNLDITSSVNNHHDEKTKTYLASQMYKACIHDNSDTPYIAPESLGAASSVDLNPHINQVYLEEISIREQQNIVMKYSKMYRCGRCKKSKTRVREIQSASLDEGSTLFILCIACGNRWRQYS